MLSLILFCYPLPPSFCAGPPSPPSIPHSLPCSRLWHDGGLQDYWTPGIEVVEGTEYRDHYGDVSPIPQHDGTECFKWDNMLWSAEAHFRVGVRCRSHLA